MARRTRYAREFRERAVALVLEHREEHESQWDAIRSIADLHRSLGFLGLQHADERLALPCHQHHLRP